MSKVFETDAIIVSGKTVKKEDHSLLIEEAHKSLQTKEAKADVHIIFSKKLREIDKNIYNNLDLHLKLLQLY